MAYDLSLAHRIRQLLPDRPGITEKQMFGGIAFMVDGHMFVGIVKDDLMVRTGPERFEEALSAPHVRPMDFSGRPMTGYVYVAPDGLKSDNDLSRWIGLGCDFASALPPKQPKKSKK